METIALLKNKSMRLLVYIFTLFSGILLAQGDSGTVEVNKSVNSTETTTTEWYADPVYLGIGAVALLIIIVLLSRSGRRNRD